ncbi:MAG: hypothetical protein Greene041614_1164 [Parcubacteria group bacterium Greene0416_14]|nr:MAG: hypothetical protein Greene041614_1164 [Parcubacteria group bacterium Greene0416_14]
MAIIKIKAEARVDIALAIDLCPVEISGIGEVVFEDGIRHITETILIPQKCFYEYTTFDWEAFLRYSAELNKRRMATRSLLGTSTKRLWWHSHVWGQAEFSSKDEAYIEQVDRDALLPFDPWFISIVGNKHGVLTTRLDVFRPKSARTTEYTRLPLSDGPYTREMLRDLYYARLPRMKSLIEEMVTISADAPRSSWELDEFSSREEKT